MVHVVTVDVSFISITKVLLSAASHLRCGGVIVALVKPQFEVGRAEVGRGGLVTIPAIQDQAVADVGRAAGEVGLTQVAMAPSPITGADGNREFFLHLQHAAKT